MASGENLSWWCEMTTMNKSDMKKQCETWDLIWLATCNHCGSVDHDLIVFEEIAWSLIPDCEDCEGCEPDASTFIEEVEKLYEV